MKKLIFIALVVFLMVGCKPTEKNYKKAYDIAMNKKKAVAEEFDINVEDLQSVEGARRQQVDDRFVWILPELVKPLDADKSGGEGQMAVVVSKFSMKANAVSQAAALEADCPDAIVCINGKDNFFVSIGRCRDLTEALDIITRFEKKHPEYPFVGLDGNPCVVSIR